MRQKDTMLYKLPSMEFNYNVRRIVLFSRGWPFVKTVYHLALSMVLTTTLYVTT